MLCVHLNFTAIKITLVFSYLIFCDINVFIFFFKDISGKSVFAIVRKK